MSGRRGALALAYTKVLLTGALWGTSGPFSVALYRMGIPPESVALLRPASGTFFLLLFLLAMRKSLPKVGRRHLWGMLGVGGLLVGIFHYAYQMSTVAVGVPATVALLYLAPAVVVGASAFLFRERVTPAKALLVAVAVGGVWLTVFGARGVDVELSTTGILWGCACALAYGSYTLFGKYYSAGMGALLPIFWSTLGGTILVGVVQLLAREPIVFPPTPAAWGVLMAFGLLTMAVGALLLFSAMKTLEAGRAAIGTTVEPLVAALLAMLLLDQTLTPWGWLGLVVLVVGVAGAYRLDAPREVPPGVGISGPSEG